MSGHNNLDLLEFSRIVQDGRTVSDAEYVELMCKLVPLHDLKNATRNEAEWFLMATTWLYDLAILLWESRNIELCQAQEAEGAPCIPGASGPWIENLLTRQDEPADFSPLTHFNVGRQIC